VPVRNAESLQRTKVIPLGETVDGQEQVEVTVKYADNRAALARRNFSANVRYIQEDGGERTITERSFPMGDLMVQTIMLVASSWNLKPDEKSASYPITPRNIETLLTPDECQQLYDAIIDMNPVWGGDEGNEN
jgi:hypothetical protein